MRRVKRGTKQHNRRKKLLRLAGSYYLNKSKLYKFAKSPSKGSSMPIAIARCASAISPALDCRIGAAPA